MGNESVSSLCVLGFLVLSCQRNEPQPLVPASGTVHTVAQAVDDISSARCDYEQRCNHIGSQMRYASRQHCMNVMRSEAEQNLNQCQGGLDHDDVRECLTQIENHDCSGTFSGLAEYKECRLDNLCD